MSGLLHAPFYFYVSYAMLRYLFHDDEVTTDEYYATGAAFTVVAWGFTYLYAAVQVVWPDSYINADGSDRSWFELLYLSFSTLTSVGLSDIVAVGRAGARRSDGRDDGRGVLRRDGRLADGRADDDAARR